MSHSTHGFTLIEILITIVIIAVILGIGTVGYNNYTKRQVLIQEGLKLKDALRNAQTNASSGAKPISVSCTELVGYEVDFTVNSYSVKPKCNPDQPNVLVATTTINPQLLFNPVPPALLFQVLDRGVQTTAIKTASDSAMIVIGQNGGNSTYTLTVASDGSVTALGL